MSDPKSSASRGSWTEKMRREFESKQQREKARQHLVQEGQLTTEQLKKMGDTTAAQRQAHTVESNRDNTLEILAQRRKQQQSSQLSQQQQPPTRGQPSGSLPHSETEKALDKNEKKRENLSSTTRAPSQSEPWLPAVDPISQQTYYWNRFTKEVTWYDPRVGQRSTDDSSPIQAPGDTTPEEEAKAKSRSFSADAEKALGPEDVGQLPEGWLASVHVATKKIYYFNYLTGASQWERPGK